MPVKALGADPCTTAEAIAPRAIMRRAAEMLRELTGPMRRGNFAVNPAPAFNVNCIVEAVVKQLKH